MMRNPMIEPAADVPWALRDYRPGLLRYRHEPGLGGYRHNFERDLHMFVLWEKSGDHWPRIVDDIARQFKLLDLRHITWPEHEVDDNFLRLYGMPPRGTSAAGSQFKRREIAGAGTFALVAVEDPAPVYVFERTFSKKVELVNRSIVAAKSRYRAWTGGGLRVHSSNALGEFFRDMSLLVGARGLDEILRRTAPHSGPPLEQQRSLAGAGGWSSLAELFEHLHRAVEVLVLRNFETLPLHLAEGDADVDALCRVPQEVAAVANAQVRQDRHGKFACETEVGGAPLALDLRFVGDGYYDAPWQERMLARARVQQGAVMVPAPDDHFFSLLYHAKVHKRQVKPAYRERLRGLAADLGLSQYAGLDCTDDQPATELLAGFLAANRFRQTMPQDIWVETHPAFMLRLQAEGVIWESERARDERLVAAMLARAPLVWRWRETLTEPLSSALRAARKWALRRNP
jgi:hypothetical protein